ncbi:MAG: hypothetical protein CMB48_07160 [Euryarchaeota archaeon]|nr:hypothetical protein [Euryarchaeota archaeon]
MGKGKIWIVLITFNLFICNFSMISASPIIELEYENDAIFGGVVITPNEDFNNSINVKDSPSIAHIFTATWCTPCVEVEQAIEDVANETDLVMLTFHRFAGETEDPFGSANAENWWKTVFEQERPLQPTAIINGGEVLIGASQGSYDNIYSKAIEKTNLNSASDSATIHTSFDYNSSELTWEVTNVEQSFCDHVDIHVNFVEDVAYFPNGSNGLKNYTHIVHHVKHMKGNSGNADLSNTLSEINAYDGEDLKLVITFGCMNVIGEVDYENGDEEDNNIPHIGFIPTIMTVIITSMIVSRKNIFESIN